MGSPSMSGGLFMSVEPRDRSASPVVVGRRKLAESEEREYHDRRDEARQRGSRDDEKVECELTNLTVAGFVLVVEMKKTQPRDHTEVRQRSDAGKTGETVDLTTPTVIDLEKQPDRIFFRRKWHPADQFDFKVCKFYANILTDLAKTTIAGNRLQGLLEEGARAVMSNPGIDYMLERDRENWSSLIKRAVEGTRREYTALKEIGEGIKRLDV